MESEAWVSFPLPLSRVLTSDRPSITRPLELKVAKPALVVEPWPIDGRGVGGIVRADVSSRFHLRIASRSKSLKAIGEGGTRQGKERSEGEPQTGKLIVV